MKKRFIILVDFSNLSSNLIKYASQWGRKVEPEIILVHQTHILLPSLVDYETKKNAIQETNHEARQKLKKLANDLITNELQVKYYVSHEHLKTIFLHLFSDPFENLIFVGLKGTGFFKRLLMGSVALHVIENSNNSIIAIPETISSFEHQKLYVAISENYDFNLAEFNSFLNFMDKDAIHITFFHLTQFNEVNVNMNEKLVGLTNLYSSKYKSDYQVFESKNVVDDIKKMIENNQNEILIIQKGSRLFTDQLFRRFLINELVYDGKTPMVLLS
jgi:predicted DNA-binding ArsR family transcriptional regulator